MLGVDGARTAIASALKAVGLGEGLLEEEAAQRVLAEIARGGGAAGAAARLAQRRLGGGGAAPTSAAAPRPRVVRREELVELLAPACGPGPARAAITRAASRLGMGEDGSMDQALAVLDAVAAEPGIVGTTARFAKARLHLA